MNRKQRRDRQFNRTDNIVYGSLGDIGLILGVHANKVGSLLIKTGHRTKIKGMRVYENSKAFEEKLAIRMWKQYEKLIGHHPRLIYSGIRQPEENKWYETYQVVEWDVVKTAEMLRDYLSTGRQETMNTITSDRMDNVIVIDDKDVGLVPVDRFEYATFDFPNFNPPQSAILPYIASDHNLVICTATSSGKTVVAEMCIAYCVLEHNKIGMFVGPLKALTAEKHTDWTDPAHCFSMFSISQCSGDYMITNDRIKELNNADIIVITPEMLSSRCRNTESEKSTFINNTGVCVIDEAHILTCFGRGCGVETSMMQLAEINPDIRLVLLSGTMNNGIEIAEWVSKLNGKKTVILNSNYRPIPISEQFIPYESKGSFNKKTQKYQPASYKDTEALKTKIALDEFNKNPNDKHLIFYHTKSSQRDALKVFKDSGVECKIYNADVDVNNRSSLIDEFIDPDGLKCLLSTSSLAWGINLPAKRVVVVGTTRGTSDVEVFDLLQIKGRAGRPKYDTEGHCTFIVDKKDINKIKEDLDNGTVVDSTFALRRSLTDRDKRKFEGIVVNTIAFHAIAEVCKGNDTKDKLQDWFKRTLAYHQSGDKAMRAVDNVIQAMLKADLIREAPGRLVATKLGLIASRFYYDPFSVVSFYHNMNETTDKGKDPSLTDADYAYILANAHGHCGMYMSQADEEQFDRDIELSYRYQWLKPELVKTFYAFYKILQGQTGGYFGAYQAALMQDSERTCAVLKSIDGYFKYNLGKEIDILSTRLQYAVQRHLASLCLIKHIGNKRASALYEAGVRTLDDFIAADFNSLKQITGLVNKDIIVEMKNSAQVLKYAI